ncbi:MAG: MarR family transcriptional regulator [Steroidobacteraceae bacterium]
MSYAQVSQILEAAQRVSTSCPQMRTDLSVLCRTLILLGQDMSARFNEQISPYGVSDSEARLLLMLHSHGGSASPGDVCALLTQSPANLTRISDILVGRGLITRAPHAEDRRRLVMSITPQGEDLVQRILPHLTTALTRLYSGFSPQERDQLLEYLLRLLRALDDLPGCLPAKHPS